MMALVVSCCWLVVSLVAVAEAFARGRAQGQQEAALAFRRETFRAVRVQCGDPGASHAERTGAYRMLRRVLP